MVDFSFYNPTRIIFGKDADKDIGAVLKKRTGKLLLHYGGGSIMANGIYERVTKSLRNHKISYLELPGVKPNPRLSLVRQGVALVKKHGVSYILAVGGGSVIDSAKAIAAGALYEGDVWDFFNGKAQVKEALPVATVLTIMAAGSEASDSCVITNDENGLKRAHSSQYFYPDVSFLNPDNTMSLPPYQIACGASDILAHLLERYFTTVPDTDYVDSLIEASIRGVIKYGPLCFKSKDYVAREQLVWISTMAHNNILSAGRIGDWASHNIEHELSAMFDLAHGAGLSIIFPAWIRYTADTDIKRIERLLSAVFDGRQTGEAAVTALIGHLKDWYAGIGLPVTLEQAGIKPDSIDALTKKCFTGRKTLGRYRVLTAEDVNRIYRLALN